MYVTIFHISQVSTYSVLKLALEMAVAASALRRYEEQNVLFVPLSAEALHVPLKFRPCEAFSEKTPKSGFSFKYRV